MNDAIDILLDLANFIDSRGKRIVDENKGEMTVQKTVELRARRDELIEITKFILKELKRRGYDTRHV